MIHWGGVVARLKYFRNVHKFTLLFGSSGSMAIRVSFLVYALVVEMFLFPKIGHEIFVFNFLGDIFEVMI